CYCGRASGESALSDRIRVFARDQFRCRLAGIPDCRSFSVRSPCVLVSTSRAVRRRRRCLPGRTVSRLAWRLGKIDFTGRSGRLNFHSKAAKATKIRQFEQGKREATEVKNYG